MRNPAGTSSSPPSLLPLPTQTETPGAGFPPELLGALERAHSFGFYGDGPLEPQIDHALGFARVLALESTSTTDSHGPMGPTSFLDLGSGGGLPGLILAWRWPESTAILLDAHQRRTEFLGECVERLGWGDRVEVVRARAELAGRDPRLRGTQPLVVARSFGRPAVVAECGAPFLEIGGLLVVSEPPRERGPGIEDAPDTSIHPDRWPPEPLGRLGLEPRAFVESGFGYQVLQKMQMCPEAFPRRDGVPSKRPLY
ncbi:MAG: RsmG family class I SAM-dependent methyltransferase [Acidimicrobiales bacterium]